MNYEKRNIQIMTNENYQKNTTNKKTGTKTGTQTRTKTGTKTAANTRTKRIVKTGTQCQAKTAAQKNVQSDRKKSEKTQTKKCPYIKKCGACQCQTMSYEKTLAKKQSNVKELLGEFGKVNDIIGMYHPYHYRNKVHAAFDHLRDGTIISGIYEENSHRVVNVDSCLIDNAIADKIILDIRNLLQSFKIRTYNEDTGYGLFRHALVRVAVATGEVMVVLVLGSPVFPSKNHFVRALLELHPEITTIILNLNDKHTSMILGEKEQVIYGNGYIVDELCGKRFRISAKSFYQINHDQTEKLYKTAIQFAGLTGNETILDAYCGIGTIGIIAGDFAKQVIGVELNKDAVRDAVVNSKMNKISNIRFYCYDAGKFMVKMANAKEHVDVVFMDPPRAGSDEAFLSSIVRLSPEKVVYISCNPQTQQRDLSYLTNHGYKVKKIQPVDLFGWTSHIESVVLLTKVHN